MTTTIVTLLVLFLLATPGQAAYYGQSWGDWTCPASEHCGIAARQGVTVPASATCVAVPECDRLGERGYLWIEDAPALRVVVCDCTAAQDLESVRRRDIVVEVPYHAFTPAQRARGLVEARVVTFRRVGSARGVEPVVRKVIPMGRR